MRLLLLLLFWACEAQAQGRGHSVVLLGLDGFRWDYAAKYGAANLLAVARNGASAPEGMLPAYPSLTFPNQYTLVTGLYPEHHGIAADSFYEGEHRFNPAEGAWYSGEPLWVVAERKGLRTACIAWIGCEAAVGGVRPSLLSTDERMPDAARVEQALAWLHLPEAERPRLVVLSLAGVDRAARAYGPEAPETRAAVKLADAQLGRLRAGLAAPRLSADLVVVSDRGLVTTEDGWVDLDRYAALGGFRTAGSLLYAPNDPAAQEAYERLKIADARFKVYRRADLPRELHCNTNTRAGDPVVLASKAVAIRARGEAGSKPPNAGTDGFDPRLVPEMKAVFYAEGPDIRAGVRLKLFENVNIYPFLAGLLGLDAPKVDGSAGVLSLVLKPQSETSTPPR